MIRTFTKKQFTIFSNVMFFVTGLFVGSNKTIFEKSLIKNDKPCKVFKKPLQGD